MKTLLIPWYWNYKGGVNNLAAIQVRNEKHETIKTFTSLKSMGHATKRAKAYQRKLEKL